MVKCDAHTNATDVSFGNACADQAAKLAATKGKVVSLLPAKVIPTPPTI